MRSRTYGDGSWWSPPARRARLSVGTGSSRAELTEASSGSTTTTALAEHFIAVCEGGDVDGLIGLLDPGAAGLAEVVGLSARPGVRGAEAVAGRALHYFGPAAGVSLRPFDLEGRAAVIVSLADDVVAVIRLDHREGRITHLHAIVRPSLVR